ncbi:MAG: PIN domain-containing protein [Firmicutes bacterium]|nr:PIN domain-containing protein [Bacillota bacterium]
MAPWLASLVVVDANTLRNDILYACCHEAKPTTLVNGANSGMLRLFCARHVLEEIKEHHQEWCETADVDVTAFAQLFNASYAPLLRVVHQVPEGLLSAEEQDRVETLRGQDPDDIPSVTLALLLRAFYMSEDRKAIRAVYGREFSREEVRAWREVLSAGGNAGVIGSLFQAGAMLTGGLGIGIWGIFDKLTGSFSPWLKVLIAAALIGGGRYLYLQVPEERRVGFRNVIGQAFRVAGAFSAEYVEATARVDRALPAVPSREQLAGEQQPRNVLTRAQTCCGERRLACPAVGAEEVAVRGVVVTVGMDQVGIDRAPAAVAKHPRHLPPQRMWCQQLELLHELHEVGVCCIVVRSGCDEVIFHQLGDVGDGVGHDGAPLPCGFLGAQRARSGSAGSREEDGVLREYRSEGPAGPKRRLAAP